MKDPFETNDPFGQISRIVPQNSVISKLKQIESDTIVLSEEDFYPPEDNRVLKSGVGDFVDGDTFMGYSEYFFDSYGDDLYDDEYLHNC